MKKKLIVLIILTFISFGLFSQTTRALIIGLSNYKKINQKEEIKYSTNDADLFAKTLVKNKIVENENILFFTNDKATKFNIIIGLLTLIENSKSGDNIIFYFSGYVDVSETADTSGYLLCSNCNDEGLYSAGDAIRIDLLKKLSNYAYLKEVNLIYFFDIFSNRGLSGSFAGFERTYKYLRENWKGSSKIISKDSTQYSEIFNDNRFNFFTKTIDETLTKSVDNILDINKLFADIKLNLSILSNNKQVPLILTNNYNFKIKKSNSQNKIFTNKTFLNIKEASNNTIISFEKTLKDNIFYSEVIQPKLTIDTIYESYLKGRTCVALEEKYLSVPNDKGDIDIFIAKLNDLNDIKKIKPHKQGIKALAKYNENIIISGSWDEKIKFWNITQDKQIMELSGHKDDVEVLALSPNKKYLVSGAYDKTLFLWILDTSFATVPLPISLAGHSQEITAIEFINSTNFISGSKDKSVIFWKESQNQFIKQKILYFEKPIIGIKTYKNYVYIAIENGNIFVYDLINYKLLNKLTLFNSIVSIEKSNNETQNTIFGDKYLFVAGNKSVVKIINLENLNNEYLEIDLKISISKLYFFNNNLLVLTNKDKEKSKLITFKITEPLGKNSAYFYYNKFFIDDEFDRYNKEKLKMYLTSSILTFVEEKIQSFIMGSFVLPSNEEIDEALFYINFVKGFYKEHDFILEILKTQRLILEIYQLLLSENSENIQKAIPKIDSLKIIAPFAAYPLKQLSQAYTQLNNLSIAQENIALASERLPNWTETMAQRGSILQMKGKYNEAILEYRKIIKEKPNNSKGYIYLALAFSQIHNYDSAQKYVNIAYAKEPNNIFVLNQKAMLEIDRLKTDSAETTINKVLSRNSTYKISITNKADLLRINHNFAEAIKYYNQLKKDITNPTPYGRLCETNLILGNISEAEKTIKVGLNKFPDNPYIISTYANFYAYLFLNIHADFDYGNKAISNMDNACKIDPFNYIHYFNKAKFLQKLYLHNKQKLIPENILNFSLADSISDNIYFDSILVNLQKAEKYSPNNFEIKLEYLKYYKNTNQTDSITKTLYYFSNLNEFALKNYYLACCYEILGDTKNAIKTYKTFLKNKSEYMPVIFNLFKIYYNLNDFKNIEKLTEKYNSTKKSPLFTFYIQTITNIKSQKYNFDKSASFRELYYGKIALTNVLYLKNQIPTTKIDENIQFTRENIYNNTWIKIQKNGKFGLMAFNGIIIIPANFEEIIHVKNNIFECKNKNKIYTFEVGINEVNFVSEKENIQ